MRKLVSVSADAKVFIKKKLETAKIIRIALIIRYLIPFTGLQDVCQRKG
jgi:hypothetical protein